MEKGQIFISSKSLTSMAKLDDKNLETAIRERVNNFIAAICLKEINAVVVLIHNDETNSDNDIWKVLLYKKARKYKQKEITLDNIESIEEGEDSYEFFKESEGNFSFIITEVIFPYKVRLEKN